MNEKNCTEQKLKYLSKNRSLLAIKVTESSLQLLYNYKQTNLVLVSPSLSL